MSDLMLDLVKVEIKNKARIKTPCADCPFVVGSSTNQTLDSERITDIIKDSINDKPFICHKTLDHSERFCAGALAALDKSNIVTPGLALLKSHGILDINNITYNENTILDIEDYVDDPLSYLYSPETSAQQLRKRLNPGRED